MRTSNQIGAHIFIIITNISRRSEILFIYIFLALISLDVLFMNNELTSHDRLTLASSPSECDIFDFFIYSV